MNDRALHLVVLVGSVNQASMASAIANTLDELAPDDVQVSVLPSLGGLPRFDDYPGGEDLPAGLAEMGADIARADGVVIVTPEHNRSFPGVLKDALDWLGRLASRPMAGKPVAMQTASDCAFGGIRVQSHLRQILMSMDSLVLGGPEVTVPHAALKLDLSTCGLRDAQARLDITLQLAAFAEFSRRLSGICPANLSAAQNGR